MAEAGVRHANEAAALFAVLWLHAGRSVLSLNAGDNHRGSELSHIVPDGLIIRIMSLSPSYTQTLVLSTLSHTHTCSLSVSVVSLVSTSNRRRVRKENSEIDERKDFP